VTARLGRGEYQAIACAIALLVLMSLNWFDVPEDSPLTPAHRSGWATVGWLAALLTVLALAATAFWIFALLAPDTPDLPFAPDEVTMLLALGAALALGSRLLFEPDLGLPNAQIETLPTAFAGTVCAALLAVGAWRAISDDVRGALRFAQRGREPRPARG
jgi:hypothetical protein